MAAADMVRAMPLGMFFDYLAMRLDGSRAEGKRLRLNWQFTDTTEQVLLNLENSVLTHRQGQQHAQADATVRLARTTLDQISMQRLTFADACKAGQVEVAGNEAALMDLMGMIDNFSRMFPVVGPRPASALASR